MDKSNGRQREESSVRNAVRRPESHVHVCDRAPETGLGKATSWPLLCGYLGATGQLGAIVRCRQYSSYGCFDMERRSHMSPAFCSVGSYSMN